jgi:hypothetical protein
MPPANHAHGATESQPIRPTQENSGRALSEKIALIFLDLVGNANKIEIALDW